MTTRRDFLAASSVVGAATFQTTEFSRLIHRPYRHRQVFGAHRAENGSLFGHMREALNAYEYDLGEGAGTLHAAAVLYGTAATLGLDDELWQRYRLAAVLTARDDDVEAAANGRKGNPFLHGRHAYDPTLPRSDVRHPSHDDSIDALQRRGASFFVCNVALVALGSFIAANPHYAGGRELDGVLADLRAHLAFGMVLVPSGMAALNAAQEARFTYVAVS
ncbi:MAG: hypothetical protein JO060_05000 [Candidatus Eremiobacteraeota bacterium]|nr:hypothetical protein [Candidatus Eremiobacteraeota bacterium]MBV9647546.1 hypothetical protein [Candidatus Eremiobacteraeota bacterium]